MGTNADEQYEKVKTLARIARLCDPERALTLLQEVEDLARGIKPPKGDPHRFDIAAMSLAADAFRAAGADARAVALARAALESAHAAMRDWEARADDFSEIEDALLETAMKLLAEAATTAARVTGEEVDLGRWAVKAAEGMSYRRGVRALARVAGVLGNHGKLDQAILLFRRVFTDARLGGPDAVLDAIARAADTIVAADGGEEVLWKVYEDIVKADEWLFAQPGGSSTGTPAAQSGQAPGSQRS